MQEKFFGNTPRKGNKFSSLAVSANGPKDRDQQVYCLETLAQLAFDAGVDLPKCMRVMSQSLTVVIYTSYLVHRVGGKCKTEVEESYFVAYLILPVFWQIECNWGKIFLQQFCKQFKEDLEFNRHSMYKYIQLVFIRLI